MKRMRLIDVAPIEEKIQRSITICGKRGDVRAQAALIYVAELLDGAAEIPLAPDEDRMKRKRYGKNRKVLLSDAELERLKEDFPQNWETWIERLDEYVAQFGNKYKNHLATIRNWARRDAESTEPKETSFDTEDFLKLALDKTYGGSQK